MGPIKPGKLKAPHWVLQREHEWFSYWLERCRSLGCEGEPRNSKISAEPEFPELNYNQNEEWRVTPLWKHKQQEEELSAFSCPAPPGSGEAQIQARFVLSGEFHLDAQHSKNKVQLPNVRFQRQKGLGFESRNRFVFQASTGFEIQGGLDLNFGLMLCSIWKPPSPPGFTWNYHHRLRQVTVTCARMREAREENQVLCHKYRQMAQVMDVPMHWLCI